MSNHLLAFPIIHTIVMSGFLGGASLGKRLFLTGSWNPFEPGQWLEELAMTFFNLMPMTLVLCGIYALMTIGKKGGTP